MNSIEFFCALQLLFYGKVEKTRSGGRKLDEKECRSGSKIVFLPNRYIFLDAPTLNIHNSTHSAPNVKQFFLELTRNTKGQKNTVWTKISHLGRLIFLTALPKTLKIVALHDFDS